MDNLNKGAKYIIKLLKEVKTKLKEKSYKKGNNLKSDFYRSISLIWDNLLELKEENLEELYLVQSFLINEILKIHEDENSLINKNILSSNINIKEVNKTLEDGKRAFDIYYFNDDSCKYYLIGDIHSDVISIKRILEKTEFFNRVLEKENIRLIFIGDYVDRGHSHLKTLQFVSTLKYLFPENIFIQKGNHDTGTFIDNEIKMGVRMPDDSLRKDWFLYYLYDLSNKNKTLPTKIIDKYLSFFNSLAILSFISQKDATLMVAHAGIPRPRRNKNTQYGYIDTISDLTDREIKDHLNKDIVNNIIWSDPSVGDEGLRNDRGRFRFTQEEFTNFKELIGFDVFIRGHQVKTKGYEKLFDDSFITVFSSGKILKDNIDINTDTAYGEVNPHIIRFKNSKIELIDLNN